VAEIPAAEVLSAIRTEAKDIAPDLDAGAMDTGAHIADIGIDSLQMLQLVARLEERLRVSLPDYVLVGIETVADLVRVVQRAGAEDW
jgi:acyl carrier protein